MGGRCTIDSAQGDFLELRANEPGSLGPKKVNFWEDIIVDIFSAPRMEEFIRIRIGLGRRGGSGT